MEKIEHEEMISKNTIEKFARAFINHDVQTLCLKEACKVVKEANGDMPPNTSLVVQIILNAVMSELLTLIRR